MNGLQHYKKETWAEVQPKSKYYQCSNSVNFETNYSLIFFALTDVRHALVGDQCPVHYYCELTHKKPDFTLTDIKRFTSPVSNCFETLVPNILKLLLVQY